MDIRRGDRVMVNLAPFIGSKNRCRESIPCEVVNVGADRFEVATGFPYRRCVLWVDSCWMGEVVHRPEELIHA